MTRAGQQQGVIRILAVLLLLTSSALAGCQSQPLIAEQVDGIALPYRFGILRWSLASLVRGDQPLSESRLWSPGDPAAAGLVLEYFRVVEESNALSLQADLLSESGPPEMARVTQAQLQQLLERKSAMRDTVEWILGRQLQEVLNGLGIRNPVDRNIQLDVAFPPVSFELDQLPHLLVVSPRERIARLHEVMLVQYLDADTILSIEGQVDALGYSSLVLGLGGFGGTYPTLVADDASLHWSISTAAEEWLHQYLAFTPLGVALLLDYLGWRQDADIGTLNETVAGIISEEIGEAVLEAYYPAYFKRVRTARSAAPQESTDAFDFAAEMRQTRLTVDSLLANGSVEEAEGFMEQRRQHLVSQGYYIRKLNQAYFAFYGSYAYEPTSVDPLGEHLTILRGRSPSLKAFLNAVTVMTDREQILEKLKRPPSAEMLSVAKAVEGRPLQRADRTRGAGATP